MAAETKTVAHGVLETLLASIVWRIVEVAIGVGVGEVNGWRNRRMGDGFHRNHGFNTTAGTERMPKLALRAADVHLFGMVAKHAFDGLRFGFIPQWRAGSVGVDIADVTGVELGIGQGIAHGTSCTRTLVIRLRNVTGVGTGTEAHQLAINPGIALLGVFQLFED